jgi:hypothetical protein
VPTRNALPGPITLLHSLLKIPHNRAREMPRSAVVEMDAEESKKRIASGDCKVVDKSHQKSSPVCGRNLELSEENIVKDLLHAFSCWIAANVELHR